MHAVSLYQTLFFLGLVKAKTLELDQVVQVCEANPW